MVFFRMPVSLTEEISLSLYYCKIIKGYVSYFRLRAVFTFSLGR